MSRYIYSKDNKGVINPNVPRQIVSQERFDDFTRMDEGIDKYNNDITALKNYDPKTATYWSGGLEFPASMPYKLYDDWAEGQRELIPLIKKRQKTFDIVTDNNQKVDIITDQLGRNNPSLPNLPARVLAEVKGML